MTNYLSNLQFNSARSQVMHIDLNSCFATIEQQANHFLRGRPIAVAAYTTPNGCILAPSVEAKRYGVKVGMRVKDAKVLCSDLYVMTTDPNKYRYVHLKLREVLSCYTNEFSPKSIDEFVLNLNNTPSEDIKLMSVFDIGREIKSRIKNEIGDYITVSIGVAPNRFLAKTASNLEKPDGLCEINAENHKDVYSRLELMDLCGIASNNLARLNSFKIFTVLDFYNAPPSTLHAAFNAVTGYYWHLRLRGWEIEDYESKRKSFSNSYSLPKPANNLVALTPILTKLVEKMCFRLRADGFKTQGVYLALRYSDHTSWHESTKTSKVLFDSRDIYKEILHLYSRSPKKSVVLAAVGCFNLVELDQLQLGIFEDLPKKERLTKALDEINNKWGYFILSPASMLSKEKYVPDRIGFGRIRELDKGDFDALQSW